MKIIKVMKRKDLTLEECYSFYELANITIELAKNSNDYVVLLKEVGL